MTIMTVNVTAVEILRRTNLRLVFDDGVSRIVDVRPLMRGGLYDAVFREHMFDKLTVDAGSLVWPNGARLSGQTLRFHP